MIVLYFAPPTPPTNDRMDTLYVSKTSNKIILFFIVLFCSISNSFSRSVENGDNKFSNVTNISTISNEERPNRFKGMTPGIITCAVLLQIFLPFFYWCFYRWCNACCMDVNEEQAEQRRKEAMGNNVTKKKEKGDSIFRLLSLHFQLSFFVWMIYLICYNVLGWGELGNVFTNLHVMAIVVMVISALFVLFESLLSHELAHIDNIMQEERVGTYLQQLRDTAPVITLAIECYHFEEKRQYKARSDIESYGDSYVTTTEKVVTHRDSHAFSFDHWEDISPVNMPWLSSATLTRLKIDAFIDFGDGETQRIFEEHKKAFVESNRHRDKKIDLFVKEEIPELEARVLAFIDPAHKTVWISSKVFWCATFLCLTWPYRWMFKAKTTKSYYELKKKIYVDTRENTVNVNDVFDPLAFLYTDTYASGK